MIDHQQLAEVLQKYGKDITIGVLGGHSALDVCRGAKKYGFRTLVVAQKGREKTYSQYYRTAGDAGCVDEVIVLDSFMDIVKPEVQEKLRSFNTIFIHNRYFWVYCDFEKIEKDFLVPMYGTREAVKLEERNVPNNQYYLLQKAGVRMPKIFKTPAAIDRLAIVKVNEALRKYERAFFLVSSPAEYATESAKRIAAGEIDARDLEHAVIEEYIVGAQVNVNYFYSMMRGEAGSARGVLEIMGTDMRRQTNLDGILRLPAWEQNMIPASHQKAVRVETGHVAVTVKESLLEKFFDAGEKFVKACREDWSGGESESGRVKNLIGPFALQGAIAAENGREELVVFDVSMRIPGSPGTAFTPYSGYLWGDSMSYGERIAKEIRDAVAAGRLSEIVT
jgi:5-formaminoimidazole-4-carboxamide-1-(beta)-D-ribofuranosyl 5'-monophosphate synthetase